MAALEGELKTAQVSSLAVDNASPLKGGDVSVTCTANFNARPAFSFMYNLRPIAMSSFTLKTDTAVTDLGDNTYQAVIVLTAKTPNVLRNGETIMCIVSLVAIHSHCTVQICHTSEF